MMITANGILLRTDLSAVREIGRATQGIRLIRLDDEDKVVAVAKIVIEDNGNGENGSSDESAKSPDATVEDSTTKDVEEADNSNNGREES